jgi:pSer/pThr/pTyr-binding forkhead associated (FHA) protein
VTDQALDILKLALLLLLYLFFARVLWAVWSEVRQSPEQRRVADPTGAASHTVRPAESDGVARPKPPRIGRTARPTRLVVLEPKERRGTTFAITDGLGIGREPDNTVVVTGDAYISGHHAKVIAHDGQVVLHDLGSRNGTVVNGTRLVRPHHIRIGDRIQIGYTVLEAK